MRATVEKLEKNQVALQVEVETEKVEEALEKAYRKIVKKVTVPGFRKGRVPRRILEARFGKEILYEEALEMLVPEAYQSAVEQTEIDPIDQPKIEVVQMESGQPLIFKATVEVLPEVKLGEYKGVSAVMPEVKVGDDEVEAQLKLLQERYAQLVDAGEGPVEDGDFVVIDYEATVGGKPEPRLAGKDETVEVGSLKFIAGFENHLLGMKVGEEKEFDLTLPSLYKYPDLAEKKARFKVRVKEIKRKKLSPLDDEFARDVSEFNTLEELKNHLRNKMEEIGHINARRIFTERVVEKVVEASEVEVPDILVKRQLEQEMNQLAQQLAIQRLTLEQYLKIVSKDYEGLKADLEEKARKAVKEKLVLGAVAKAEGLRVTPEELEEEIKDLAAQYGQEYEKFRKQLEERGQLQLVEQDLLLEKARKFLADHAIVLPNQPEAPDEQSAEEAEPQETTADTATASGCEEQEEGEN
ncbi:MAG: Trigger factor [Thermoanaerobacterales bacterium 50_218]|nr:MAG: Trigger factor [Thermoanaerobacterales bacterium 50_218]HAA89953.1 trigger factor [Peptococcaceae bacterium]